MDRSSKVLLSLLISIIILLCGCWDSQELDELALIVGSAIDYEQSGRYQLTTQFVNPHAIGESGQQATPSSNGGAGYSITINTSGRTIYEALTAIRDRFSRKSHWSHMQIIIISEEIAAAGVAQIIDIFDRSREARNTVLLAIAKDNEARDLLTIPTQLDRIPALALVSKLESAAISSHIKLISLRDFALALNRDGQEPVLPVLIQAYNVYVADNPLPESIPAQYGSELYGLAVFKSDKLIGWLDKPESRGYLWIVGEIKHGSIVVPSPNEPNSSLSFRILSSSTKHSVSEANGQPEIGLSVEVSVEMAEQMSRGDLSTPLKLEQIKQAVAKVIKTEIDQTLTKVQHEYNSDIFGFGRSIDKYNPKLWCTICDNWDQDFRKLPVTVQVQVHVERLGLITKSYL